MTSELAFVVYVHAPLARRTTEFDPADQQSFAVLAKTVVPLLEVFHCLSSDQIPFRLTLSLSASLLLMMNDSRWAERYQAWVGQHANKATPTLSVQDIALRLGDLADAGHLELITTPGTNVVLPLVLTDFARDVQLQMGLDAFTHCFGKQPNGLWLNQYAPGLDHHLAAKGIRWTLVNDRDIANAWPEISGSVVHSAGGIQLFGVKGLAATCPRTGDEDESLDAFFRAFSLRPPRYQPIVEDAQTTSNSSVSASVRHLLSMLQQSSGLITIPCHMQFLGNTSHDAHLWIETFFRELKNMSEIHLTTPSEWLANQVELPSTQVQGNGDYSSWLHPGTGELWTNLHAAELQLLHLQSLGLQPSALNTLAQELAFAQASDWLECFPEAPDYGYARAAEHLQRFETLAEGLGQNTRNLPTVSLHKAGQRRLKIAMLSWEFPPDYVGGLGRHVYELGAALARAGHEVHVFTLADKTVGPGTHQVKGMLVHRVPRPANEAREISWTYHYNQAFTDKALEVAAASGPFDVVHSHDWMTAQSGFALKLRWGMHWVASIHSTRYGRFPKGYPELSRNGHISKHLEEWTLATKADTVITVSQAMGREVQTCFRVTPATIYNGVNLPQPVEAPVPPLAKPYLLFIGRLVHDKGIDVAIRALRQLDQVDLVIAGKGPLDDLLLQLAKSCGVADRVHFVGWIDGVEKDAWIQHAKVGLVPSRYEPFGIVAIEFMAAGIPVVVSDVGGPSEIVTHKHDGLKFTPNSVSELVNAIHKIISYPEQASHLSTAGRDTVTQRFGWDSIAAQTIAIYRREHVTNVSLKTMIYEPTC